MSVGGAIQTQGKVEHEYDRLVKVVKQTEGGQNKRNERISLERHQKYRTSEKQERDTTLQYHTQEYLTPIKHEPNSFQNRPNKAIFPGKLVHMHIQSYNYCYYIQRLHTMRTCPSIRLYRHPYGCACLLFVMTAIGKSEKPL